MGKAIMGRAKCLSYMIEVLNNYKFNQEGIVSYEDINLFIPHIVPLGYVFSAVKRNIDNNQKCFILYGSKCAQIVIYFQGTYDHIEHFNRKPTNLDE